MSKMMDLKTELIIKTAEYELKIVKLEVEYKKKHKDYDERKMEEYINRKLKQETKELLQFNIIPPTSYVTEP